MKNLLIALLVLAAGVTVYATVQQSKPADCGSCPEEAKAVQVKQTKEAGCCAEKAVQVKQAKEAGCCGEGAKAVQVKMAQDCGDCPADKMAECAAKQGDCGDCDMSGKTKQVKVVKGMKAEQCGTGYAKYKVYVDGKYYFYGCEESAGAARTKWTAKAFHVGTVQKVVGKVRIPANQAS